MSAYDDAINAVSDFPMTYVLNDSSQPILVQSFRPTAMPEKMLEGDFPCAVCWGDLSDGHLSGTTFMGGGYVMEMDVEQHVYWTPSTTSLSIAFSGINGFWSKYIAATVAYPFYGPPSAQPSPPKVADPISVKATRQKVEFGDYEFHTLVLKHKIKVFL